MRRFLEKLLLIVATHVRAMLLHPMDVGAVAIVEQAGRIVLVRHSYKSGWMFPGGAVERGEPPASAVIRELQEEIGLTQSAPPQLLGAFVRRRLWATNLILLYRVRDAVFVFKPNWEIRELRLADPAKSPSGTAPAVRRRLRELLGEVSQDTNW
jgi:8-oxo-dGTP pyrophosphatase MutT (NUDIX family)